MDFWNALFSKMINYSDITHSHQEAYTVLVRSGGRGKLNLHLSQKRLEIEQNEKSVILNKCIKMLEYKVKLLYDALFCAQTQNRSIKAKYTCRCLVLFSKLKV